MHTFDIGTLIGYSAVLLKDNLAIELEHANVRYIEADQVVTINDDDYETQKGATWGIDRIDQSALPLDGTYSYFGSAGANVVAYVIDTGVFLTHSEFEGRAKFGFNAISNEGPDDGNGHGTHVAGTIGGITYGVAKKVTIVAVKVLSSGGSGTWAGVVAGVDWVTKDHQSRGANALSVGNMSLGGGKTPTLDSAVTASVAAGVNHVVAAGNDGQNACNYSPANVPTAITVGATTSSDGRAYFSNIGTCVDIFAPGMSITSAWIGSETAINTISGTSMASPHVAGAVAMHLGHLDNEGLGIPTPEVVAFYLTEVATENALSGIPSGTVNLLLFSEFMDVDVKTN